ncbi:Uncharacterized N-acetyltransferase p20 [Linum perenne]
MVWASDGTVAQFCSWEPYTSKEEALNFIENSVLTHPWYRAICLNGRPIGVVFVSKNSGGDACRGELGYVLGSGHWGKGIAPKAVKMVTEVIFKERPELERVEAVVDVDNGRSQRVLEKVGFVREGVMRSFYNKKKMEPELKNEISLRPLKVSDIDDFMVWTTDDKVARFCTWEPYTSKEDGLNYIKNTVIPHPWFKAICINGRPIGAISVSKNSGGDACRGELGYVLASGYWGKGIATTAVKMVTEVIFEERPEMERLEALVDVENVGSQRVLEKAGFVKEGVLRKFVVLKGRSRDMVMFSLLSTEVVR